MLLKLHRKSISSCIKSIKVSIALAGGLFLLSSCLVPEDTPPDQAAVIERDFLLPVWADSQIYAVDVFHPTHSYFLDYASTLPVYRLSSYTVSDPALPTKTYFPYFTYQKAENLYVRSLWPNNYLGESYIATLPANNKDICQFSIIGGSNSANDPNKEGQVRYVIPGTSGVCDDYSVFDIDSVNYDVTAPYPMNNKTYQSLLYHDATDQPLEIGTIYENVYNNSFAILPTIGRMIADYPNNQLLWFPSGSVITADFANVAAENILKSNVGDYSYIVHPSKHLLFFLVNGNVYVFDIDNQSAATALADSNKIYTISANSTPNLTNFFFYSNDRVYFIDDLFVRYIRLDTTNTQGLYPVATLRDWTNTGPASLELANFSDRYFYFKEIAANGSDYDLVSISQEAASFGTRHFLATLDTGATIKLFNNYYYVYDNVKGINAIFNADLDYSDGVSNQAIALPANTVFAGAVLNTFTADDPGPQYVLLSEQITGDNYKLYYFNIENGESFYLGDIQYPVTANNSWPTFRAELINDKLLLIKTVTDPQNGLENGVAIARIDLEGFLTPVLTGYNQVISLR